MVQFTNFIYSIVNTVAPFMTGTVAIYIVAFSLVVFIYDIFFGDGSILNLLHYDRSGTGRTICLYSGIIFITNLRKGTGLAKLG